MNNKAKEANTIENALQQDESRIKDIFDPTYQFKFLKCFLEDNDFYEQIMDIVVPEFFDEYQRLIIDYIIRYINKFGIRPDYDDLKRAIKKKENRSNVEYLLGVVEKVEQIEIRSREEIRETSYTFFKKRALGNALLQCVKRWGNHDFESISEPITEALKAGEPKDSGYDYVKDLEKSLVEEQRHPIACMPGLDAKISGGLAAGEFGIVMAPTGGGKSMFLIALAANAFRAGLNVMYYTLELGSEAVSKRFHACLNNIEQHEVTLFKDKVRATAKELNDRGGQLKIKKYNSRSASVNTIKSHLNTIKRNENFVPDIIFIDYADIMKPMEKEKEHRHTLQILYQHIRSISEEFNAPLWSATQANRSSVDEDQIGTEGIADSYGKAAEIDLLISIARPNKLKVQNLSNIFIAKNRLGADGFSIDNVILDTSRVQVIFPNSGPQDMGQIQHFSPGQQMQPVNQPAPQQGAQDGFDPQQFMNEVAQNNVGNNFSPPNSV